MSARQLRLCVFAVGLVAVVGTCATVAAAPKGKGTMLVRQSTDCSGTGNASTVTVPFSVLFTGFTPGETGTATAYTQPGGVEVGHRTVVIDVDGEACERVTGDVPPGQYKIVYDFGSGTGKQKVIRITGPEPPSPSAGPSQSVTPTSTPTGTSTPTTSVAPTGGSLPSPPGHLVFTPVRLGPLAHTGSNSAIVGLAVIGGALLFTGLLLILGTRRSVR